MDSGTKTGRRRRGLSVDEYAAGVVAGDRTVLARAITLVESSRPEHREQAQELLVRILPKTGNAHRIGVTGVPGVGKSTFVETMGCRLADGDHRVAVLAVDPSSSVTGGSILGDKTRMARLATHPAAFVRPSPSGTNLGGVARKTREAMLLCEAAGFDVILVETVGVGQAEVVVAEMVDFVLLLLLPSGGDELQGIKRGILEWIDLVAINKADGDRLMAAREARSQYAAALRFVRSASPDWRPPVLTVSALEDEGLSELWQQVEEHHRRLTASGALATRRREQQRRWMWALIEDELLGSFRRHPAVVERLESLEDDVVAGRTTAALAARRLLDAAKS